MEWFYNLSRKARVFIAVIAWLPLFIAAFVYGDGGNNDSMGGGESFVALLTLAIGIFFTVFAIKATRREKAEQREKAADEQKEIEEARARERAAKYASLNEVSFSARIIGDNKNTSGFPIHTKVKGVTFEGRQEYLAESSAGDALTIEHAPTTEYPNSISVTNDRTGDVLGNIGSDLAATLLNKYGEGCAFVGEITEITGGEDGLNYGCNIVINNTES